MLQIKCDSCCAAEFYPEGKEFPHDQPIGWYKVEHVGHWHDKETDERMGIASTTLDFCGPVCLIRFIETFDNRIGQASDRVKGGS